LPLIRNPYYKSYRSLGLNPNALQINDYKSTHANKGTPFISYALDSKEDKTKEEEGKDENALFIKEGKQEEEVGEGLILSELS
jgi:hypothetical protein